ncbi:hypothetical protein [uncultured Methylobacterium sp.]|uniref:hypothetical protein n=1 Tax=uncultured Methylobacterium sp. TaxID=157278 RepID=UPI0035CB4F8C
MTRPRDGAPRHRGCRSAVLALALLGSSAGRPLAEVAEAPSIRTDPPPATAPARGLNPLSALDPTALGAFRGRPLFAPSRRPPPPRPAAIVPLAPVVVASPPPDLRLVGVVAGADRAVAILRRPAGGPSLNLKVGDTVEAWRVETIAPDRVTLRDGERATTYRLFAVGGPAGPAPASRITNPPQLGVPGAR